VSNDLLDLVRRIPVPLLDFVQKHRPCDTVRGNLGLTAPRVIIGDYFDGRDSKRPVELPIRSGNTRLDLTDVPLKIKSRRVIRACHRMKEDHFGPPSL
jgi:hypothetical protein